MSEWECVLKIPESCTFPKLALQKRQSPKDTRAWVRALENTCCLTVARQKGGARGTLGHASDPFAMLDVLRLPRKRDRAKRNRANIRRLGNAFHTFHSLEPQGTPEHVFDILLSLQKTWTRRTPGRTPDPLISNAHCSTPPVQKRRGEGPATPGWTSDPFARNIRPHCQKKAKPGVWKGCHSKDAEPEGRHAAQPPLVVCGVPRLLRKTHPGSQWMIWVCQIAFEWVSERMERRERIQN